MEKVSDQIEEKIRNIGLDLYSGLDGIPPVFDGRRWTGRIMEWAMKNEDFKLRLFRFIDVLPSLRRNDSAVSLLQQYFDADTEMPAFLRGAIGMLSSKGIVPQFVGPVLRKSVESVARQFIAGNAEKDVKKAIDRMLSDGAWFSLDILGEVVVSDKEARMHLERYLALLDFLKSKALAGPASDISIKVSSFYSQLDPVDWNGSLREAKNGLRPLLRKARDFGISITFDMEHYYLKGLTLAVFKSLLEEEEFAELPVIGIAIQAYLRDSEKDMDELLRWAGNRPRKITIRLVKGAYWDYEVAVNRQKGWQVPVFLQKAETDANFEKLCGMLFQNKDIVYPAIATHNLRSMSFAIACGDSVKTSGKEFEFQVLYGMAEPLRKALRERAYRVRIYTPVGELIPGMAYFVRRLLENTSNESFLRRSFGKNASFPELIKKPRVREETKEPQEPGFRNEPVLDFSIEENRYNMSRALQQIPESGYGKAPLIIGNSEVFTAREIISVNPAKPTQIVGTTSSAGKEEADAALEEALKARDQWRKTAPEKRASCLFRAAGEMRKQRFGLAALEVVEVGKTWKDADGDVAEAVDYLEYYGREMLRLSALQPAAGYPGEKNEYFYMPKGIGVVISPWNFPLAIATGMTSAAIVAGNCVIFKPSGLAPMTAYRLVQVFRSVGLPDGVLQFLPGPGKEVGEYLVAHPSVDFVAFTGSREVGLRIVKLAGETKEGQRNLKKVVAEMGGKNAIIVDETADVDEAVKGIVESAFGYQGQKCSACSRLIVVGNLYDELCVRLAEAASSLKIGNPQDPGTSLGPVIDQSAVQKIFSYREIGRSEGKTVLEETVSNEGHFAGPSIFTDVARESRIAREEIFGPILTVMRAKDIDHAIQIANDSIYALTGGLFSRSPANIMKVKEAFVVGNLYINRKITGALVGRQPFGGFGMSGIGSKAGGPDYLLQFLNPVSISENTIRRGFAPLERE